MIPIGQASTAGNQTFKSTATIAAKEGISMGAGNVAEDVISESGVNIRGAGDETSIKTNDSQVYLQTALKNQRLDVTPNRLKETCIEGDYKYTVRIHEGNTKYTDASSIYRVSRQSIILDANGQGTGLEYLGTDGNWYRQSVLTEFFKGGTLNPDFNENAARITHIAIKGGN